MAEMPEGAQLFIIPKRYIVAGALTFFINAGCPSPSVAVEEPPPGKSVIAEVKAPPRYQPNYYSAQAPPAASAQQAATPGIFVEAKSSVPYKSHVWIRSPQLADQSVATLPESTINVVVPNYIQRPSTTFINLPAQPIASVAGADELIQSRRVVDLNHVRRGYRYKGQSVIVPKADDLLPPFIFKPFLAPGPLLKYQTPFVVLPKIQVPDVVSQFPINDRTRIILATYPYKGKTTYSPGLDEETPSSGGLVIVASRKCWPDFHKSTFVKGTPFPPATVVFAQDDEAWSSRKLVVVPPPRLYKPGALWKATFPVANVIVPQDEEGWASRRSITLGDYSKLWSNPNLSSVYFKQIQDELGIIQGIKMVVVPPPVLYNAGDFKQGIFLRTDVTAPLDELLSGRRVSYLAPQEFLKWFNLSSFYASPGYPDQAAISYKLEVLLSDGSVTSVDVSDMALVRVILNEIMRG